VESLLRCSGLSQLQLVLLHSNGRLHILIQSSLTLRLSLVLRKLFTIIRQVLAGLVDLGLSTLELLRLWKHWVSHMLLPQNLTSDSLLVSLLIHRTIHRTMNSFRLIKDLVYGVDSIQTRTRQEEIYCSVNSSWPTTLPSKETRVVRHSRETYLILL